MQSNQFTVVDGVCVWRAHCSKDARQNGIAMIKASAGCMELQLPGAATRNLLSCHVMCPLFACSPSNRLLPARLHPGVDPTHHLAGHPALLLVSYTMQHT